MSSRLFFVIILAHFNNISVGFIHPKQQHPTERLQFTLASLLAATQLHRAKLLIDRTKGYTNLFILDSGINKISTNESAVKEICDYATNAGLNIIVNLGTFTRENWPWQLQFFNSSKEKYGDKFLGAYYDDEVGGIPFDWDWPTFFTMNSSLFYGAK